MRILLKIFMLSKALSIISSQSTCIIHHVSHSYLIFVNRVRAKKYIVSLLLLFLRCCYLNGAKISASGLEEHPNPHVTTLLGIIYAARENKASVDVYLTNPPPKYVFTPVAAVLKANNWTLEDTRIHLLVNDISHYGTVALYDDDVDDPGDWVTFQKSGADFWNDYREMIEENYPKIMESMRDLTYDSVIPPKRSKPNTTDSKADSKTKSKASKPKSKNSFVNSHHGGSGTFVSDGKLTNELFSEGEEGGYQLAVDFDQSGSSLHYTSSDDIPYQPQPLTSLALAALNEEYSASGPNVPSQVCPEPMIRAPTHSALGFRQ